MKPACLTFALVAAASALTANATPTVPTAPGCYCTVVNGNNSETYQIDAFRVDLELPKSCSPCVGGMIALKYCACGGTGNPAWITALCQGGGQNDGPVRMTLVANQDGLKCTWSGTGVVSCSEQAGCSSCAGECFVTFRQLVPSVPVGDYDGPDPLNFICDWKWGGSGPGPSGPALRGVAGYGFINGPYTDGQGHAVDGQCQGTCAYDDFWCYRAMLAEARDAGLGRPDYWPYFYSGAGVGGSPVFPYPLCRMTGAEYRYDGCGIHTRFTLDYPAGGGGGY